MCFILLLLKADGIAGLFWHVAVYTVCFNGFTDAFVLRAKTGRSRLMTVHTFLRINRKALLPCICMGAVAGTAGDGINIKAFALHQ